jgi:hypothetical protein
MLLRCSSPSCRTRRVCSGHWAEHHARWLVFHRTNNLQGMGFTEAPCRHALTVCSNDVNRAVEYLFNTGGQEQEVVDMTMSPDLDHHDVWEWYIIP